MARGSRRHRRRKRIVAVGIGTCTGDGEPTPPRTTSIHDLPDDLLELVLLRVRTPVCLFRAAATCKLWRRVIAGDGFLHRVRSLHRPNHLHLLGHYSVKTTGRFWNTVAEFVPFPTRPARPAAGLRQRLSLDFPIDGDGKHMLCEQMLTDSRGSLVAFVRDNWYLIVCDPWTRQYRELRFPWARPVEDWEYSWYVCLGAFFLDAGDGDERSSLMSSFSVLCVCLIEDEMSDTTTAEACVFSARDNCWIRWTVSGNAFRDVNGTLMDTDRRFVGRAGGSIFFGINDHILLVLDEATGNFSTICLPQAPDVYNLCVDRGNLRVVNGGAGTQVRIVRFVVGNLEVLKVTRDQHGGWEWMVERSVGLCQLANIEFRADRSWRFLDTTTAVAEAEATLVLGAFSPCSPLFFSFDVQTMELQPAKKMTTTFARRVFPYELPWPQRIN